MSPTPHTTAILLAAGQAKRMGTQPSHKPLLEVQGRTLLEHCARAFDACSAIQAIVVVCAAEDLELVQGLCTRGGAFSKVTSVAPGGTERSDSVRAGIEHAPQGTDLVAVHDVARCLVTPGEIDAVVARAQRDGCALLARPVTDTIKRSADGQVAAETVPRGDLWCAQTPQVFAPGTLIELLERARSEGWQPTDDASLHERYRGPVPLVEGLTTNIKITYPADLLLAEAILRSRGIPAQSQS